MLKEKYASVISAAESAGISDLSVNEQDGVLYISGKAWSTAKKDVVWDALGAIDATYTASDINLDIQINELTAGTTLTIATESSNLNIRQEPSTEAPIVGKAAKGEEVVLVEQTSNEWWKIKTKDGEEGYAYTRYLSV